MVGAAVVVVAAVVFIGCLHVVVTEPSVYYVNNSILGSFLEKPGMTLDIQDAYITLNVKDKCSCRAACKTQTRCLAVAMVPDGKAITCRLADKGPTKTNVTADPQATYTYWESSLPTGTYGLREDGMLYLVVAEKAKFTAAKELCSKIPGHRLAITKIVKQYETLLSLASETQLTLWVDLRREPATTNAIMWGDDTFYNETETSKQAQMNTNGLELETQYYRLKNNVFHDITLAAGLDSNPLCQADPVGSNA